MTVTHQWKAFSTWLSHRHQWLHIPLCIVDCTTSNDHLYYIDFSYQAIRPYASNILYLVCKGIKYWFAADASFLLSGETNIDSWCTNNMCWSLSRLNYLMWQTCKFCSTSWSLLCSCQEWTYICWKLSDRQPLLFSECLVQEKEWSIFQNRLRGPYTYLVVSSASCTYQTSIHYTLCTTDETQTTDCLHVGLHEF